VAAVTILGPFWAAFEALLEVLLVELVLAETWSNALQVGNEAGKLLDGLDLLLEEL